ncbi:MAG: VOC family protein [Acidobacteriota bacterium]|nr:VOC family protein [Acidobacteriota bacterium]MDH3525098.1 VOC family protein [Acidobacteriota bacterium]
MKCAFDCVFYYVSNLERSIRFYSEVLGLKLVSSGSIARFDLDGVLLELVPTGDESKLGGAGNSRVCLAVPELDLAVRELQAKGVSTGDIQTVTNGRFASFRDPDGNELVLWQTV